VAVAWSHPRGGRVPEVVLITWRLTDVQRHAVVSNCYVLDLLLRAA